MTSDLKIFHGPFRRPKLEAACNISDFYINFFGANATCTKFGVTKYESAPPPSSMESRRLYNKVGSNGLQCLENVFS